MLTYDVVIPVKPLIDAKTRLSPAVDPTARAALARAFALDTITAALAAPRVARVVVVGDLSGHLDELPDGVVVVAEPEPRSLASAVRHGIAEARRTSTPEPSDASGRSHRGIAVLLGDLPALTAAALGAALDAASRHPLAFMPDSDGTGTTLATAGAHTRLEPAFGTDSAARHRALGFRDLSHEVPAQLARFVRRDVDTVEALDGALRLGVGTHTAEAVAEFADGALGRSRPEAGAQAIRSENTTASLDSTRKGAA
ncbi:2-phospho-L-lactate guanylyltransferase [Microterricola viridarii]|uniref:Phosphoenolpyruvate guanylyltransferase n=1 Tax=Microterricola viridarii TaxID=412690 RepID=A0A0Y0NFL3_9MICO|nr:2-phospho-L-lactate guanylyltransferase [Microterricola viridarii]AMB60091.1 hypothetical protein AWU67_15855 [Microterricola viridarii]